MKYPKLGKPGQTGDGIKSQDENSTQEKKQKGPNWFFHLKLILIPSFGFALPAPSLLFAFFDSLIQLLSKNKKCSQFSEMIPNFVHFMSTFKWGMKQGLGGQSRAQRPE